MNSFYNGVKMNIRYIKKYVFFSNVDMDIKSFLPREEGPGFVSTPDIIKRFWVTPDNINR